MADLGRVNSRRTQAALLILMGILELHTDAQGSISTIENADTLRGKIMSGDVGLERMRKGLTDARLMPATSGDLRAFAFHATQRLESHLGRSNDLRDLRDDFQKAVQRGGNHPQQIDDLFSGWNAVFPHSKRRK